MEIQGSNPDLEKRRYYNPIPDLLVVAGLRSVVPDEKNVVEVQRSQVACFNRLARNGVDLKKIGLELGIAVRENGQNNMIKENEEYQIFQQEIEALDKQLDQIYGGKKVSSVDTTFLNEIGISMEDYYDAEFVRRGKDLAWEYAQEIEDPSLDRLVDAVFKANSENGVVIEKKNEGVWYEEIVDDLRVLSRPVYRFTDNTKTVLRGAGLIKADEERQNEGRNRLTKKGVNLDIVSRDVDDGVRKENFRKIRNAVDLLFPRGNQGGRGGNVEEAAALLADIGVDKGKIEEAAAKVRELNEKREASVIPEKPEDNRGEPLPRSSEWPPIKENVVVGGLEELLEMADSEKAIKLRSLVEKMSSEDQAKLERAAHQVLRLYNDADLRLRYQAYWNNVAAKFLASLGIEVV